MTWRLVVVSALLAASTSPAPAQNTTFLPQPLAIVDTGARVRLAVAKSAASSLFGEQRLQGRISGLEADTVRLQLGESLVPVAIPRTRIRRLESSIGSPSRFENIVEGALLVGSIMAIVTWSSDRAEPKPRYEKEWHAVVAGAGLGMLMGGYLKSRWPLPEHWRPAQLAR
jgi:hypothetical protein